MLRLLDARFPNEVLGYVGCNPSQVVKWDDEIKQLIEGRIRSHITDVVSGGDEAEHLPGRFRPQFRDQNRRD
eukprot:COSAG01_NODE_57987_length_309_cov_0.261905_1_plen_71_part_01